MPGETYSTPVMTNLQGKRAAIIIGPATLNAVEPSTGKVMWSRSLRGGEYTADPVVAGDRLFTPHPDSALLDVSGRTPRVVWTNRAFTPGISTPVVANGLLFVDHWDSFIASWA